MGARDLLDDLTRAGLTVTADAGRLLVRPASKLTDAQRQALRAAKADVLALLTRPYGLTPTEGDRAHVEPWDDAVCLRFVARVATFMRCGFNATDADDLAERLHLRDVDADDRTACVECRHARGTRCTHATMRIGELGRAEAVQLRRCHGFESR